jgi:hypothetical protein
VRLKSAEVSPRPIPRRLRPAPILSSGYLEPPGLAPGPPVSRWGLGRSRPGRGPGVAGRAGAPLMQGDFGNGTLGLPVSVRSPR